MTPSPARRHPSDPLKALGPSLFLSILSELPFPSLLNSSAVSRSWRAINAEHATSLWRAQCHKVGVERNHMAGLEQLEAAMFNANVTFGDPEEPEWEPPEVRVSCVNWKEICMKYVSLQRNWKHGRAKEEWAWTPEPGSVWRFKVGDDGCIYTTSETGCLEVIDPATSQNIFTIGGVRPYAHLEHAAGHFVFDTGTGDFSLEVWRTQAAIRESPHPTPKTPSPLSWTVESHTQRSFNLATSPLPRGHIAYYRTIRPPTRCRAFRARVDKQDTPEARAKLATAGEEAVYIWDLDDPNLVETIRILPEHQTEIHYVEFDDDFVFLCGAEQMVVLSRRTRERLVAFPDKGQVDGELLEGESPPDRISAAVTYAVRQQATIPSSGVPVQGASTWGRESRAGAKESDRPFVVTAAVVPNTRLLLDARARAEGESDWFCACHYTSRDLVCMTLLTGTFIVMDYRRVFESILNSQVASDPTELVKANSVWLDVGGTLLSTYRDHVGLVNHDGLWLFDLSRLSSLPLAGGESALARRSSDEEDLGVLRWKFPDRALSHASCLQLDRAHMWVTYRARFQGSLRHSEYWTPPPMQARDRLGACLRGWDFTSW